jgi:hypothetical protein
MPEQQLVSFFGPKFDHLPAGLLEEFFPFPLRIAPENKRRRRSRFGQDGLDLFQQPILE